MARVAVATVVAASAGMQVACGGSKGTPVDPIVTADTTTLAGTQAGTSVTVVRSTLSSLARAHGGTLPTTGQLTQMQSEQLSGSIGQALEGLAQVPGALETTTTPVIPQIPAKDVRIDR